MHIYIYSVHEQQWNASVIIVLMTFFNEYCHWRIGPFVVIFIKLNNSFVGAVLFYTSNITVVTRKNVFISVLHHESMWIKFSIVVF